MLSLNDVSVGAMVASMDVLELPPSESWPGEGRWRAWM